MATLNEVFSAMTMRRRYEVWFVRLGLTDGSGAWWFRYLLTNPGRGGCDGSLEAKPVQVWATWFPAEEKPQTFIREFPLSDLEISRKEQSPFYFRVGGNGIDEDSCHGALESDGHAISWNLRYYSTFRATLSSKGWIGFSRTPHSDAVFSGQINFDGRTFKGDGLGFGVQGHNCGYRHRHFWTWAHAYFQRTLLPASTLEALVYEMPFGLVFRKAVLWHNSQQYVFRDLRESGDSRENMRWNFSCRERDGLTLEAAFDGFGISTQRLPYLKTNCTGRFEVVNNSLASSSLRLRNQLGQNEELHTAQGAVLEIVG